MNENLEETSGFLEITWSIFVALLNSSFGAAIAGAFAGAWGAYLLGRSSERRNEALKRLNAVNSAVAIIDAATEHSLGFKDQLTRPLFSQFHKDRGRFESEVVNRSASAEATPFEVEYMLGKLSKFRVATDDLERLILLDAGVDKLTIKASSAMIQSIHSVDRLIDDYNQCMDRLHFLHRRLSEDKFAHRYFGFRHSDGMHDEILLQTINGLAHSLDSIIWFGLFVMDRMITVARTDAEKLGKGAPKPYTVDYSNISDRSLIPSDNGFSDWIAAAYKATK